MSRLTETERSNLQWMKLVNDRDGVGLYWPTVHRCGALPECAALIESEMADLRVEGDREERGYWITDLGRSALAKSEE